MWIVFPIHARFSWSGTINGPSVSLSITNVTHMSYGKKLKSTFLFKKSTYISLLQSRVAYQKEIFSSWNAHWDNTFWQAILKMFVMSLLFNSNLSMIYFSLMKILLKYIFCKCVILLLSWVTALSLMIPFYETNILKNRKENHSFTKY